jgi:hypothetical protein
MKIIPLAHKAIGNLALIGLLFSPFALTPSYAAELVGKPVPVGAQAAAASAAQTSGEAQAVAKSAVSAGAPAALSASNPPNPAAAPVSASAPAPAEPPTAPDFQGQHDALQSTEEIRKAIDELRESIHHDTPSDFDGISLNPETIIPIVAMLLLFGGPVLLVIVLAILHYRAKMRRQQNINMNIDKLLAAGRDIPVELLMGDEVASKAPLIRSGVVSYSRDDNTLQKGVRNIGLGTGWLLFLTIMFGINIGSFGFIFIGLGISQLVIWKLSSPNASNTKAEVQELLKAQD